MVVGVPISLDGTRGPAARQALEEVECLRMPLEQRGIGLETADERLTTVTAEAALEASGRRGRDRRQVVDAAAAAVLLQAWLDSAGFQREPGSPC